MQLCAQVLLLRETGYRVDHAEVYFAETRTRHRVPIDDDLVEQTLAALAGLRTNAAPRRTAAAPRRASSAGTSGCRRDLPPRRGQRTPRAPGATAAAPRCWRLAGSAAVRDDSRQPSDEARRARRPARGSQGGRLATTDRRLAHCPVRERRHGQRTRASVLRRRHPRRLVHYGRLVLRHDRGHAAQERRAARAPASRGRDRHAGSRGLLRRRQDSQLSHAHPPPRRHAGERCRRTAR